jgi:phosphoribosyl 1,2-cyclic phosphate phosphodiesterase
LEIILMAILRFTILGSGSSGGVPRLGDQVGGLWGACDPTNPKNNRRRCSLLVERITDAGRTRVLIDTSPDLRSQLLDAGVGSLDGVVYTHLHADHVHGIDDLRMVVFNMRRRLPVWADVPTRDALISRFGYAFLQAEGSSYPAILDLNLIDGPITISGLGGEITLNPFPVKHGNIDSLGFRVADVAYLPDVSEIYEESWKAVENLDVWILDALRREPHPTHTHFARSLEWMKRAAPKRGVLTNMHFDLDYQAVCDETEDHITAAFDGMVIEVEG